MCFRMVHQGFLPGEPFATLGTAETFCAIVCVQVAGQVGSLTETRATLVTHKRFLSRVCEHVHLKIPRIAKYLVTCLASDSEANSLLWGNV